MNKLVVGAAAAEVITCESLRAPIAHTLHDVADALGKAIHELTVFVLDKPRHVTLIDEIRAAGARVLLRTDGDVAGALMAASPDSGVDVMLGIGGTPEGIIAACAVRALGGAMLGQLAPQKAPERAAVLEAGYDLDQVLTACDLVRSDDLFFAATGITDGVLLHGVHYVDGGATTDSLVMRGKTGTTRTIRARHRLDKLNVIRQIAY
jgi:fructose-1,6-bisphosphatase II